MMSGREKAPTLGQGIVILLPLACYPVIDFVFRIANGIVAPNLTAEFSLDAADLGLVSSVFFIAFGLAQLPLGVALDRFGPKATMITLLATAICGALTFIHAYTMGGLIAGRILLGIGMSASLIAGIKTATLWLPGRLPMATSILVGATGIGGMIATVPFAEVLEHFAWRDAFLALTTAIGVLIVVTFLLVPATKTDRQTGIGEQFVSFSHVFRSAGLWRYAPITMTCVGVGSAYQTLWAPLWLRDVAGYGPGEISWVMLAMLGIYALGNLAFGWIAQTLKRRGKEIMPIILLATMLFIFCQILLSLQIVALATPLWIAASLVLSGAYALYPLVTENFPAEYAARASSALNFLVFLSVFAIQWLTGLIIGSFPETTQGTFLPDAYNWAMAAGIGLQLAAIAWYFLSGRRH